MSGSRGGFSITISAVDQATKSIDAINKRIAGMSAPAQRLTRSMGRLADTTGVKALTKGVTDLGRSAFSAFENLGRMAGPMGAITGAASIAGIANLVQNWAGYAQQLDFAARRSGQTVTGLQTLQGAARLAGSSAEALTSGMTSLNDNLHLAGAGMAPEAQKAFQFLGVSIRDAGGHIRSSNDALPELADRLKAIKDPTLQAQLATALFGSAGENLLPFLRRGAAGIREYEERARSYGVISEGATKSAEEFKRAQTDLSLATQGLGNAIGESLSPVLTPMVEGLADWIKNNRGLIATDISGWATTYGNLIKGIGTDIDEVVKKTVGWNNAIGVGGPAAMAQMIPQVRSLEAAILRLVGIQIPLGIGKLLGITATGSAALGAAAVGAAGLAAAGGIGYAESQQAEKADLQAAQQRGLTPVYDTGGQLTGFRDAKGEFYSRLEAHRIGLLTRPVQGGGAGGGAPAGPAAPQQEPFYNPRTAEGRAAHAAWLAAHAGGAAAPAVPPGGAASGTAPATPGGPGGGTGPAGGAAAATNAQKSAFYNGMYQQIYQAAVARGLGNPAAIAATGAAQASLETGYGQHVVGNNYFGIKAGGGVGTGSVSAGTTEVVNGQVVKTQANFAAFGSQQAAAQGYVDFLTRNPRYAGVLAAKNPQQATAAIGGSGYATDPNYAQKLASIEAANAAPVAPGGPAVPTGAPVQVASNAPQQTTVKGGADLRISLSGFPQDQTTTAASTTGDLWSGPPQVSHAMPLLG